MSETRDNAIRNLREGNYLCFSQRTILNFIIKNPLSSRQKVSDDLNMAINSVCGRVKELIDFGEIVEDGQSGGQSLLRVWKEGDKVFKPQELSHLKFENLKKNIREAMLIANSFQKKEIFKLVEHLDR